jgi:hypothetical protein
MKRQIKKIADLTQKQYEAALSRYGMELDHTSPAATFDVVSGFGFQLMGKTRRAKLAHAIDCKDEYDESQIRDEADYEATPITGPVDETRGYGEAVYDDVPRPEPTAAEIAGGTGNLVDGAVIPSGPADKAAKKEAALSTAVEGMYLAQVAHRGAEAAGKLLQSAIKACGQKILVDGRVGPYTIRLANRIAEADLVRAFTAAVQAEIAAAEKASV